MFKKITAFLIVFFVFLSAGCNLTFAAVTDNTVEIKETNVAINIYAKASPGERVAILFLEPDTGEMSDEKTDKIAYIGQINANENGYVEETFYIPEGTGSYTLRMSNCTDVSYDVMRVSHEMFAASWSSDFKSDYIYPFFRLSVGKVTDEVNGEYVLNEEKVKTAAESAKEYFRTVPEGRRVIIIWQALIHMLNDDAENYIWWDNGRDKLQPIMESFFKTFSEIGGKVDAVVTDFESGFSIWHLGHSSSDALLKYKQIESDERYQSEIKPLLEERDFVFCDDEEKGELYWACYYSSAQNNDYHIWNKVMANRVSKYLDEAAFDIARKYFPNCKCSNYGNAGSNAEYMMISSGHETYKGGNTVHAGTHSSFSMYGSMTNKVLQYMQDGTSYTKNGFTLLKYDLNRAKAAAFSDENGIMPWVANPDYTSSNYIGSTPYYHELILHTGLLNPDMFLYWGPRYNTTDDAEYVQNQAEKLNKTLIELNSIIGFPDRETISTQLDSWNNDYVLTGMKVNGKNVWRITPNLELGTITRDEFLIDEETPEFKISGTKISFSEGSIIENSTSLASVGYWVETPVDVFPSVTYDPDYYAVEDYGFLTEIHVFDNETGIMKNCLTDSGATVRVSYKNRAGKMDSAVVFAALYNKNGSVKYINKIFEGTIYHGEDGYKLLKLDNLPEEINKLKVFLWDGASNITPLGGAIELAKTE